MDGFTAVARHKRSKLKDSRGPHQGCRESLARPRTPPANDIPIPHTYLFDLTAFLGGANQTFPKAELMSLLAHLGYRPNNPKIAASLKRLEPLADPITRQEFSKLLAADVFFAKVVFNDLAFPHFNSFANQLRIIYEQVKNDDSGEIATYIPQLARANPRHFGVSVCTVDSQQKSFGDTKEYFCIQSISKAITYGLALEECGEEYVHRHVGMEPSGYAFNERILNSEGKPHNPCINSGAIMCCSMVKRKEHISDRFEHVMETWKKMTGGGLVTFSNPTYLGEQSTADRNYCLAYMMQEAKVFPSKTDIHTTLNFYFMQCSIQVTTDMLAVAASTLANGGICPLTGIRVFKESTVKNILAVIALAGLYDDSGSFQLKNGFPVKSGVGGGLLIIIPEKAGFATWSPKLDRCGNSRRGILFCDMISSAFKFHRFSTPGLDSDSTEEISNFGRDVAFWFACASGDMNLLQQLVARGVNLNLQDYDARTGLHLSASEGHMQITRYLLTNGANPNLKDRFGHTPLHEAKHWNHEEVAQLFEEHEPYATRTPPTPIESLFRSVDFSTSGVVTAQALFELFQSRGLSDARMPHLKPIFDYASEKGSFQSYEEFEAFVDRFPFVADALKNHLVAPDWDLFVSNVSKCFHDAKLKKQSDEHLAGECNRFKNGCALSLCTLSGQQASFGDSAELFPVASISRVVNYLIAQELNGVEKVRSYIGHEPHQRGPDDNKIYISLNHENKPHNPFKNSGGIVTCSLILPEKTFDERFEHIRSVWSKLAAGTPIHVDEESFRWKQENSDRSWALAYLVRNAKAFPEGTNLKETLDLFHKTSSLMVTTEQLAMIGATLANAGINPLTGAKIFSATATQNALSMMGSCGLSGFSGEWSVKIGIPAKRGSEGGILAVVPGFGGFASWSPRVDRNRISMFGIDLFLRLSDTFMFHIYDFCDTHIDATSIPKVEKMKQTCEFLFEVASNDLVSIRWVDARYPNYLNARDYDGRTALHLAACEGRVDAVELLVELGANKDVKDRWEKTPYEYAIELKYHSIVNLLGN